jgi:outer membrane lipoprotein SlyB
MRRLCLILAITTTLALNGCAVYSVTSGIVYLTTDKALPDHMSSTLAQADCNAVHAVTKGYYYCEQRDISKTYNRQWP